MLNEKSIYNLIEVANTHGGSEEYLLSLLDEFSEFQEGFGVKFQPFKYDEIATEDFEWYPVYQELFFDPEEWSRIINYASATKDVWLDVSSDYSCRILAENSDTIKGIKLQSSMLFSQALLERLGEMPTDHLVAIVSVAGLSMFEIKEILKDLYKRTQFREVILQIGFQGYPTELMDSGLSKIETLRVNFEHKLSFADHVSPESQDSWVLPLVAGMLGVQVIEKHVKHSERPTEYDTVSSMQIDQFRQYIYTQRKYSRTLQEPFLNQREASYLEKTMMTPSANRPLQRGQLVSGSDVNFRRSNKTGLDIKQMESLQTAFHVLSAPKKEGDTFRRFDFKRANVASIIACRLKSTRLPGKALLELRDGMTAIQVCQQNCLKLENVNFTILATSDNEEDSKLQDFLFDGVRFHVGSPEDVIDRYLSIVEELGIDVILRFTGDCPYPSNEIVQVMLKSHFATGADYTEAKEAAVGSAPQIINAAALRKVRSLFPITDYSEYMNGYLIYNPDHFKLNYVELPERLIRDYRLTLDYDEDLKMMRAIESHFAENNVGDYQFIDVLRFLDDNPDVPAINQGLSLIYKQDPELRQRIKEATTYRPSAE